MSITQPRLILASCLLSATLLAGCKPETSTEVSPGASSQSAEGAPAAAAQPPQAPGVRIAKEDINVAIEQVGPATYQAADDTLNLRIKFTNNGKVALPIATDLPVRVGVVLLVPGADPNTPERRDVVRVMLPNDVAPGASVEADAKIDANAVLGGKLQLEGLQENVGWFSAEYGQPALVLGPFKRCDGNPKSLCNEDNSALAATP